MGEWKDGKKHGQGTFTYGKGKWEGDKYEGEFKVGYRNGQGTYTLPNGSKFVGEWRENKSWNGKEYDKKGIPFLAEFSRQIYQFEKLRKH